MSDKKYTYDELVGPKAPTWAVLLGVVGLLAIAVGTLLPILRVQDPALVGNWWKWVYASGAVCFLVGKLFTPYKGSHPRIKRLYRIETWSAIFFCVASFFLFYNGNNLRDIWAFTLAGGVLLIFTTITIPMTIQKTLKKQKKQE